VKTINGSANLEQAAAAGAQLMLAALFGAGAVGWVTALAYATALWSILASSLHRSGTRSLGPADHVTLLRAVLVGGVTTLVVDRAGVGVVFISLVSVALVLDAVDGRIARRTGTASELGARFDMEIDAFLILVLSVQAAWSLHPWVLAIGLARYLFVALGRPLPWLRSALPPSFARKAVGVLQGVVLVVADAGVVPYPVAITLTGLALGSLTWSFGRDVRWLWWNRHPRPPVADVAETGPPRRPTRNSVPASGRWCPAAGQDSAGLGVRRGRAMP
jgi:phosphatidylglycerophosphate synthase